MQTADVVNPVTFGHCAWMTGHSESAGINRHVVGDERALQERKQRIHPSLESCRRDREVSPEA
jgi:hypothetical protein